MVEILFWLWVVLIVGGTIAVTYNSPSQMVATLVANSIIYILPAYLIRQYLRKRKTTSS